MLFLSFGIFGLCLLPIHPCSEKPEAIKPQTTKWKTIQGHWKEASRAENFLLEVLDKSKAAALSVAVV